ncbi:MAG: helix-turn-helix domain-containing protein [Ktedonobacteraceae bacterium]
MEHTLRSEEEKRPYHSLRRQRQAEETHRRILVAARELLASRGYARMTLEAIAEAAGVSPKTVFAVIGSKTAILAELVAEIVNPAAFDVPVQHLLDRLRASQIPVERVELVALITRRVYESLTSEFELLRTAGVVTLELADLARQIEARRRQRQTYLIADLHAQGVLRRDLSLEEATDVLWSLTSYDLYHLLVVACHWEASRYESWLTTLLIDHLLQSVNG